MKNLLNRVWSEDEGVLTFEWILLITVVVIGIVGGLSAVRDAVIMELGDVAEAMVSLDQSYTILVPWSVGCDESGASDSCFVDEAVFGEGRGTNPGQGPVQDCPPNGGENPF